MSAKILFYIWFILKIGAIILLLSVVGLMIRTVKGILFFEPYSWTVILYGVYAGLSIIIALFVPEKSWSHPDLVKTLHKLTHLYVLVLMTILLILYHWELVWYKILPVLGKIYFKH